MEKAMATFDKGTLCSAWNYSANRLATASADGDLVIFDSPDPSSSSTSLTRTSNFKAHEAAIIKIVWIPPEYGDSVACICSDGTSSLWEEVVEDAQPLRWKLCKRFKCNSSQILDIQFGNSSPGLKMIAAFSDGHIKVYELMDPLNLKSWQLQGHPINMELNPV